MQTQSERSPGWLSGDFFFFFFFTRHHERERERERERAKYESRKGEQLEGTQCEADSNIDSYTDALFKFHLRLFKVSPQLRFWHSDTRIHGFHFVAALFYHLHPSPLPPSSSSSPGPVAMLLPKTLYALAHCLWVALFVLFTFSSSPHLPCVQQRSVGSQRKREKWRENKREKVERRGERGSIEKETA